MIRIKSCKWLDQYYYRNNIFTLDKAKTALDAFFYELR